jgi:transposase
VVVIWDGAPIHHGQAVKDLLKRGAAKRLHLERLPGYAPDVHPDEGIWNYLKRVELANICCHDVSELRTALIHARERPRHKREVICACSRHCGYLI